MALSWYVSEDGVWDQKGDQHFIERSLGGRDVSLNSFLVRADDEYVENYNQAKRNNQSSGSLRRTKGTMANPSPGEHVGPLSSAATGDVMPWKSTVYIMSHILPGFTITDSVPFPQGQELAIGVLRSLGEGRGCGLTYMMCQRIEAGNPNAGLATNVTGFPCSSNLWSAWDSFPACLLFCFLFDPPSLPRWISSPLPPFLSLSIVSSIPFLHCSF